LMGIMAISGLSVCLSVIVLNMRHGAERKYRAPHWLNFIAYHVLGRLFGTPPPKTQQRFARADDSKDLLSTVLTFLKLKSGLQMERVENEEEHDELVEEWSHISAVFDRFFFCCIFVLTGAATFTLLLLAPRFSHRSFDSQL
uniref:Neur_chan_memb domain-containing protein n=1 Tax=Gongylonema pulchrum TaxID=637853 RepID=A0A183D2N8_9BILA